MSLQRLNIKTDEDVASSVGRAFETNQIYSLDHPAYIAFSEAVTAKIATLAQREVVRKGSAVPLVITQSLDTAELNHLEQQYPEFLVKPVPVDLPGHAMWAASQDAANALLLSSIEQYGETIVHVGGSVLMNVLMGKPNVHVEFHPGDPVAVHRRHVNTVTLRRFGADYASLAIDFGVELKRKEFDKYMRQEAYVTCSEGRTCCHSADAMCIDLSQYAMSPVQVAMAMEQHGADVSYGHFIYHPSMLVEERGEFPGTGVWFERNDRRVSFQYPKGQLGVAGYSLAMWSAWLASHSFRIDAKKGQKWYQLELLNNRGPFMFFRMVRLSTPPAAMKVVHALEMSASDDYSLVQSWGLKDLASDPLKMSSWYRKNFLVRSRVLNRVFEFAMQLDQKSFSRHAIKKQVRVVNNRWVVAGTTVSVAAPLDPGQVEDLTTAIYARAFVQRYDSSQLSAELMKALKDIAGFNSYSFLERVYAVSSYCVAFVLDWTVGIVVDGVRSMCDGLRSLLGRAPLDLPVSMRLAPTYLKFESVVNTWRQTFSRTGEGFYSLPLYGSGFEVTSELAGGLLTDMMVRSSRAMASRAIDLVHVTRVITDIQNTRVVADGEETQVMEQFVQAVRAVNEVDSEASTRHNIEMQGVSRVESLGRAFRADSSDDPVADFNQAYGSLFPEVAGQDLQYDSHSLSLDPQDRVLAAPYLRMSTYFGLPPTTKSYYESKIVALNIPKRQNTAQELLSAVASRNLSAPAISAPQDRDNVIKDVWNVFLDNACVPGARAKLKEFQADPVALGDEALIDWASKAKPEVLKSVIMDLENNSRSLGEMPVNEYLAMLKADLKPTLSTKPVENLTAPQVIVYHQKTLSSLFSSIFRVLVRRFLSLLDPKYHVNLLKDNKDIAAFIRGIHPYGEKGLKYLENDFSKYDKSQDDFVFALEAFVFTQLGMNIEMLERWCDGHVECSIRSMTVQMSLHVLYQRKSGDATTAFGNVILNILSVTYAYAGTEVVWATFMGDDSTLCVKNIVYKADPVRVLAEIFNLTAKNFITDAPYFASNFIVIDDQTGFADLLPDPVKRMERLSMHVSADDPCWDERFESCRDTLAPYTHMSNVAMLAKGVTQRYDIPEGMVEACASALATIAVDRVKFRSLWKDHVTELSA